MKRDTIIKLFFVAVFLYILGICSSCGSSKVEQCRKAFKVLKENGCLTSDTTHKDTTIYRVNYKDTTILVKKDSAGTTVENPCNENGKLKPINKTYKSGRATVNIKTDTLNNEIIASATCDELEYKLKQKETVIDHYRETVIKNSFHVEPTTWDHAKEIWWLILLALILGVSVGMYLSNSKS